MTTSAYNPTMPNSTKTMWFYPSSFTGDAPRKGKRIPLKTIKYNEQRDEETGYGYFGARYMDHELMTSFISVDRYSSKYPSISPYVYCAWNPIRLIDPSGDTVILNVSARSVGTTMINLYSKEEVNNGQKQQRVEVPVYEVILRNESGECRTYYYTRIGYRGVNQKETTFDVQNEGDSFRGVIKNRWSGTNNVLELRDLYNEKQQTVSARKGNVDMDRTAIQFHTKGATDGCLMSVGRNDFKTVSPDEIIDPILPKSSSSAQRDMMDCIMSFRQQDQKNGYDGVIIVSFEQLYTN